MKECFTQIHHAWGRGRDPREKIRRRSINDGVNPQIVASITFFVVLLTMGRIGSNINDDPESLEGRCYCARESPLKPQSARAFCACGSNTPLKYGAAPGIGSAPRACKASSCIPRSSVQYVPVGLTLCTHVDRSDATNGLATMPLPRRQASVCKDVGRGYTDGQHMWATFWPRTPPYICSVLRVTSITERGPPSSPTCRG